MPLDDAAYNAAHAALLALGLARRDLELIARGLRDRVHQPYRASLFPRSAALLDDAPSLGALGATISGAGPSVLVWCARGTAATVTAALTERAWLGGRSARRALPRRAPRCASRRGGRRGVGADGLERRVVEVVAADADLVAVRQRAPLDAVSVDEHAVEASVVEHAHPVDVADDQRVAAGDGRVVEAHVRGEAPTDPRPFARQWNDDDLVLVLEAQVLAGLAEDCRGVEQPGRDI